MSSPTVFTAGTKIQTAEGEKNIEDIQIGDKVLAKDEKTGKQEYKKVIQLFQKQVDTIYQVHVGKELIETTAEHPFWVAGKGWVHAKDLQSGDKLETDQGQHVKVTQIFKQEKQKTVYNFEVKDYHTYYVSGLHLLVHNKCIDSTTLNLTKTAENHFYDLTKKTKIKNGVTTQFKGESVRPYVKSPGTSMLVDEIIASVKPTKDSILPNGLRWDAPGGLNGKQGTWELVIDRDNNTIVHFLFNPKK